MIKSLLTTLQELGITKGDTVCVSSDIGALGIPEETREIVKQKGSHQLLKEYLETLQEAVGDSGTLLMPTFTYSACKNELYHPQRTPSTVGAFTEFFRKQPSVQRTSHAIFSFAIWGQQADAFMQCSTEDCFGENTVFDQMFKINAKYLLMGIDMSKGSTHVYYSEQKHAVPYRYFKDFTTVTDESHSQVIRYFVRDYEYNYSDSWEKLQQDSIAESVTSLKKFNGANLFVQNARDIDLFIQKKLFENSHYLIKLN